MTIRKHMTTIQKSKTKGADCILETNLVNVELNSGQSGNFKRSTFNVTYHAKENDLWTKSSISILNPRPTRSYPQGKAATYSQTHRRSTLPTGNKDIHPVHARASTSNMRSNQCYPFPSSNPMCPLFRRSKVAKHS